MEKSKNLFTYLLLAIITLMFAGCGGGGSSTPAPPAGTGSVTADANGTVAAGTTVSPPAGVTSMTFNSASVLTDSTGAPVTGAVTTTVTSSTSASSLPAAAPSGTSLAVLLDITMSKGTTQVKNFSTPLTVVVPMPAGVTSVDVYSFNGTSWVLETAGVAVTGGSAIINITHLSDWACFFIPPFTITTTSLPGATVGTAYSQTLAATGGTGTLTWTWAAQAGSTLPPTTELNLSTAGVISGTPTTAATYNVVVTVTDSTTPTPRTATQNLTITVSPAGSSVPPAPSGVVATGGTNSNILTWPAVTGATSYKIYFSATTGVTTANGTLVTVPQPSVAVTSPYRHSRLTTAPTYLAAGTPYFYIVTAVNASGESLPSAQATGTTAATDGVTLYTSQCAGCHGSLANSAKKGRTAAQIQSAINGNAGGMGSLSGLTPGQVQAIADVLVAGF